MTAPPWIDLCAAILRGTPKLPGALCRHRAQLFDADDDDTARRAAELCARCPARQPCSVWAAELRHNEINGIVAGQFRQWVSHPSELRNRHISAVTAPGASTVMDTPDKAGQ